jgi:hypothetical protein
MRRGVNEETRRLAIHLGSFKICSVLAKRLGRGKDGKFQHKPTAALIWNKKAPRICPRHCTRQQLASRAAWQSRSRLPADLLRFACRLRRANRAPLVLSWKFPFVPWASSSTLFTVPENSSGRAAGFRNSSRVRFNDLGSFLASIVLSVREHRRGYGHGLPVVGRLLGHTQASTTSRYAHLADDPLRSAANQIAATISAAMGRADRGSHAAQEKNEL